MIPPDGNKVQASNPKKYRGKKPWNKPSQDPKPDIDFQGRCTDLGGYTFDPEPRASRKLTRKMKELERYLQETYSDSCQPAIWTENAATFPELDMPTRNDLGAELSKIDGEMTYLEKNNIDEAIHQNLRKKDVYESDMHKIYNLIVGQTDEQLKEKATSDATFQAIKADQYLIGYLMILKRLCFSNQSEQHPIF